MTTGMKKHWARLLALALAFLLLGGLLLQTAARAEDTEQPMTVQMLLSMMGSRRYIGKLGAEDVVRLYVIESDGVRLLRADVRWQNQSTHQWTSLWIEGLEISLAEDTLVDKGDGNYGVIASIANPLNGEVEQNEVVFTVKDDLVTQLKTTISGNDYVCKPNTFAIHIADIANGSVTADPAEAFPEQTVRLTPVPADFYQMSSMSVSYLDGSETRTVDVTESRSFVMPAAEVTVSAEFVTTTITFAVPTNGSFSVSDGTHSYALGTPQHAAPNAVLTLTPLPDPGYVFDCWTVNGVRTEFPNDKVTASTLDGKTVSARFTTTTILFASPTNGSFSVSDGTNTYALNTTHHVTPDTVFTLTPQPAPGYVFDSWTVDGVRTAFANNRVTASEIDGKTVSAVFTTTTVRFAKPSNGSIGITDGTIDYELDTEYHVTPDTVFTLTPQPDPGYVFDFWTVDGERTEFENDEVTASEIDGKTVSAEFTTATVFFAAPVNGSFSVTDGTNSYALDTQYHVTPDTVFTLTPAPDTKYEFAYWTVDGEQTSFAKNEVTASRIDGKTVSAEFRLLARYTPEWLAALDEAEDFLLREKLHYASSSKYNAIYFAMQDEPETMAEIDSKIAALRSAIRAYVESNALAEGYEDSVNMTDRIENAKDPTDLEPWVKAGEGEIEVRSDAPYTDSEGVGAQSYFETADSLSGFDFSLSQEIELPAGIYIFTAKLRGSGAEITLMANGQGLSFTPDDSNEGVFGNGWDDYTVEFEVLEDGTLPLLVNMTGDALSWAACGDFRVSKVGDVVRPELYAVLCQPAEHGTVSVDKAEAEAGETVTVSAEPEEGYTLDALLVTDAEGNEIETDGLSFTMPASVVKVSASFVKIKYPIVIEASEHGTVGVSTGETLAPWGEEVTLVAVPEEGYLLQSVIVTDAEGNEIEVSDELSFVMPMSEVRVQAVFAECYKIVIEPAEGGTVTADKTEAIEGDTVSLTVETEEGYLLQSLTVTDADGNEIELADDLSFAMPASEVRVQAVFARSYAIVIEPAEGGTVTADRSEAIAGESVTLTVDAEEDYRLESLTVTDADGNEIELSEDQSFTMPASAVTVRASFEAAAAVVIAPSEYGAVRADREKAFEGDIVTLTVIPEAYSRLDTITVLDENGNEIALSEDYSFTMPAGPVTVRASFVSGFAIVVEPAEGGTVTADREKAFEGETVQLTVEPEAGYQLDSVLVLDENGSAIELSADLRFTMPAGPVTVQASFVSGYAIAIGASEHGTVTADVEKAFEGETVKLTVEPEDGYLLDSLSVLDKNGEEVKLSDDLSFTMPAGKVTVRASFVKAYKIEVNPSEHGTVSADKSLARAGDTVRLTVTPEENYNLKQLVVSVGDTEILPEDDLSFTMPSGDVTVTATFEQELVTYTLRFYMNAHGTAPESQTIPAGGTGTEPTPDPTAEGYDFEGWYADSRCTEPFDFTAPINENTTAYAKWVAFEYQFVAPMDKTWQKNSTGTLSFMVKRSTHDDWTYDRFESLVLDGRTLVKYVDYTVEPGSLIITLRSGILNTKLARDEAYELKAVFSDGETGTSAKIKVTPAQTVVPTARPTTTPTTTPTARPTATAVPTLTPSRGTTGTGTASTSTNTSPRTGDDSHIVLWSVLGLGSLLAIIIVLLLLKKKGKKQR